MTLSNQITAAAAKGHSKCQYFVWQPDVGVVRSLHSVEFGSTHVSFWVYPTNLSEDGREKAAATVLCYTTFFTIFEHSLTVAGMRDCGWLRVEPFRGRTTHLLFRTGKSAANLQLLAYYLWHSETPHCVDSDTSH